MSVLDQFGNPARSTVKFVHAADTSRYRGPQFLNQNKSLEDLITEHDRDVVVSLSKRLYTNFGPAKAIVNQKATYSVGAAWLPRYTGSQDPALGDQVKRWFLNAWYPNCDVRGPGWDWWANLESVSREMDICGDSFTLLTRSADGDFPLIQNIPAHVIRTKGADQGRVSGGDYDGFRIIDGIIYSTQGRPLAYRAATGKGPDEFIDLPARSVIHCFDPALSDGKRGLPALTHALEDLKHILQSTEYERTRQLILSSIGLMVENDIGGPDPNDPSNLFNASTNDLTTGVTTKEITPAIWYAQAGSGEKISQLKHESGGDSYESFQDRMIRSTIIGADWSYSFVWKPAGQGTAERAEILRVRKSIQRRQKHLDYWAKRVLTYAYSIASEAESVPMVAAPFAWQFTKPPRPSVDDGREAQMLREDFKLGTKNLTDILEAEGKTYPEHIDQRIDEVIYRKQRIAEKTAGTGVTVDDREVIMLTPNEQPSANQPTDQSNEN